MKSIKIISITILLLILVNPVFSQRKFNRQTFGLSGKVSTLSEYKYSASEKFGEAVKGDLKDVVVYKFNEKGDLTEKQFTEGNWNKKLIRTYQYNEKGQIVEANDSDNRIIYKSDSKGNVIEEAVYTRDGDLKNKSTYLYDVNNREIEERTNISGTQTKTQFKYDINGNKNQEILYIGDSKFGTSAIKYDSKGNPIEEIVDSQAKIKQQYKYTFDEKGNFLIKSVYGSSSYGDLKYEMSAKEIIEHKIEYELTDEEKAKVRIEAENQLKLEEQRKADSNVKENLRIDQERIRKEENARKEAAVLLSFLNERKTKYYNLDSLSKSDFSLLKGYVTTMLHSKIIVQEFGELSIGGFLELKCDTTCIPEINTEKLTSNKGEILPAITASPFSFKVPGQKIRNYKVNIKASIPIDVKCSKTIVSFKLKKSNEIAYSKNEPSDKIKQLIRKKYQIDPDGQNLGNYTVEYFSGQINDQNYEEVKTIKYKLGAAGVLDYMQN